MLILWYRSLSKILLLTLLILGIDSIGVGQTHEGYRLKLGVNADYSFSGSVNTVVAGPALFWEKSKDAESGFWQVVTMSGGLCWSRDIATSPVTSVGYFFGNLPGLIFGVSTQQYYNMVNYDNSSRTDIRLSGEVFLALFGFVGYRYQHPLIIDNESRYLSRHALVIKVPIPVKSLFGS